MTKYVLLTALCASGLLHAQNTAAVVSSANAFLATLDEGQKSKVLFDYNDAKQRVKWSNLPTTMVPRAGLKLGDLNDAQRKAAMALMASALSKRGYEKIGQIMEGDEILKKDGGGRGATMFGRDLYYISLMGKPSPTEPWMIQFGGHHLALNLTVYGREGILTPSHTAAQPAKYEIGGKVVRPLGQEQEKATALLNSLNPEQRKQAVLNYKVADLVLGPGQDGKAIQPEGLKASALNAKQQAMLLDVISEWAGIVNDQAAAVRMADIKSKIGDTWFAWSDLGTAAYYRIQGPTLVIEYSPQPLGGDLTMHTHTIYRDPTNDYGKKSTGK